MEKMSEINGVIQTVCIEKKTIWTSNLFDVFSRIEQFGVTYKSVDLLVFHNRHLMRISKAKRSNPYYEQ